MIGLNFVKKSLLVGMIAIVALPATADLTLDGLLTEVRSEQRTQRPELQKREAEFLKRKKDRKAMLNRANAELDREEKITIQLMAKFNKNEKALTKLEDELNIAMGTLGELFGVVRQNAGDLKGQFTSSVISAQLPDRINFMADIAERKILPAIKELEGLWYELQREMTESGKIVKFKKSVVLPNGKKEDREVTRVGAFNLVSDGVYLNYQGETKQVTELPRQPSNRYLGLIGDLEDGDDAFNAFALDPSRGSILAMLVQAPGFFERIGQGGIVGYVIIFLLFIGLGLVAERFITLRKEGNKIYAQLDSDIAMHDNPLGQIMKVYDDNKTKDIETLEMKMEETIIKTTPRLERGIGTIKILAAVAPLLGLLGTVTGMIATFQSITLFGTGDPKLMAGGISQALVTTVLGLCCAIPLLLLHNMVNSKSKALVQILEEQTAGLLASRSEKGK